MERSTHSCLELCALISLDSSPVATSQTSVLCKPIATASSASNCCKYLVSLSMILPYCPPPKRNRNGNHLSLHPKIGLTENESNPSKRLHSFLSQRLSPNISSARGKGVSVEGHPSLTHTLNASTHAQCFYKTAENKSSSPTTNLLASKEKTTPHSKPKVVSFSSGKPTGTPRDAVKPSPGLPSAKARKDPSEVDCWTCGQKGHYSGDCPSNTKRKSLLSKNKPFRSLLAKQAFSPVQTQAAIRIMDTYNQSVCHNCLVHGCRGHNCNADDREIHEAIPEVMAVLHENPDLQRGLLDAAAATTSAAVVATLTFNTYFSLAGDADIDSNDGDSHAASQRNHNLSSYFNDEEDDSSSPSGGEEVEHETRDSEEHNSEDELPLDTFFLPPLSDSRFFLRHKGGYEKPSSPEASCDEPTHGINTNSDLFWTLHNPTEEPSPRIRGAICKAYREVKDPMNPNEWCELTILISWVLPVIVSSITTLRCML
jgi:hypothetical protein